MSSLGRIPFYLVVVDACARLFVRLPYERAERVFFFFLFFFSTVSVAANVRN